MLWCNTQQQQHDKIIKKLTEISHRKKCMTDLFSCSTPNETLHKVKIDIYEAVYHFQLLLQSASGGVGGWGCQLAVSACRSENQICKVINCDTGGGLNRRCTQVNLKIAFGMYMFPLCTGISLYIPII